ncbi:salutaridinol 7-O-acetyltransferase-like [Impatiens glandulifera]|uniref:salutaridinol 7-O-acetyltransferase-like n=1 Tax=Impatiens glandulifera TaxID=253017 RepID=UPI001FB06EEB|nr:salutaridinol 7-O-acetyltransferase-like [Impatiens glandulifera]
MAQLNINILSNEFVRPLSPTKDPFKKYHLSVLDLDQSMPNFFFPVIFYYDHDQTTSTTQLELSSRLRESLSQTLTMFYPFAGRLNRADNSIDCNDTGLRYLEAKVDSKITEVIKRNDAQMVDPLIPNLTGNGEEEDEIFAIQVNYFSCGGIAIGTYVPHKMADGLSFFSFMTTWAAISLQHAYNNTLKQGRSEDEKLSGADSNLFPVYDVDFGMGKPVWTSIGSLNIKNCAVLLDSKCGDGIEAWVTMNQQDMARFQLAFDYQSKLTCMNKTS